MLAIGHGGTDQEIALVQVHGDDAGLARVRELGQRGLLDRAARGGHEDEVLGVELAHRQDHIDLLAIGEREHVNDRTATRVARPLRHFVHFEPVQPATVGEAQDVVVRVGHEQRVDPVVFLGGRSQLAAPATLLRAVLGDRLTLHIAAVRERDDHVLRRNQILGVEFGRVQFDGGAALVAEFGADGAKFVGDDGRNAFRTRQDVQQVCDHRHHFAVFLDDLVLLQAGEALQAHLQDFLRLAVGEAIQAIRLHAEHGGQAIRAIRGTAAGSVAFGTRKHVAHEGRVPRLGHQLLLGDRRRRRGLDDRDELVDVRQRHRQAFQRSSNTVRRVTTSRRCDRNASSI
ncbi:hypothetical protein D3C86_1369840 [compost metagenome]